MGHGLPSDGRHTRCFGAHVVEIVVYDGVAQVQECASGNELWKILSGRRSTESSVIKCLLCWVRLAWQILASPTVVEAGLNIAIL